MAAPLRSRSPRTALPDARPSRRKPLPRTSLPGAARVTSLHDPAPPLDLTDRATTAAEAPVQVLAPPVLVPAVAPPEATRPPAPTPTPTRAPTATPAPALPPARPDHAEADPREQLASTLADLHEVFSLHPHRPTMPACRHCVSDADRLALAAAPDTIPDDVLVRFTTKALITWGETADLKRLLPEILGRTIEGRLSVPPGLVGARLRRAEWRTWPAAEAPALRRTLQAAWLAALAEEPGTGLPATRMLSLIAGAESDLSPYLDAWEDRLEAPGDPGARLVAVLHLADVLAPLAVGGRRHLGRMLPLARRGVVGQLDHWLRQPSVVHRLLQAAEALDGTEHAERIGAARRGLARLRTDA